MISLPTVQRIRLAVALESAINEVVGGSGWGSVIIDIRDKNVQQVQSKSYRRIEQKAVLTEEERDDIVE